MKSDDYIKVSDDNLKHKFDGCVWPCDSSYSKVITPHGCEKGRLQFYHGFQCVLTQIPSKIC